MKRKHIFLIIITDQQRFDTINALGFPYKHTPNLDRLVRDGTSFDNCFVTAPSCVPSRASLFSGYCPHATGVLHNGQAWPAADDGQSQWAGKTGSDGWHGGPPFI